MTNAQRSIEALSVKVGLLCVVLGIVQLCNVFVLNSLRRPAAAPGLAARRPQPTPDPAWGAPGA